MSLAIYLYFNIVVFSKFQTTKNNRKHVTSTYRSNMKFVEVFYQHLFRHFWVCDNNTWFKALKKSEK